MSKSIFQIMVLFLIVLLITSCAFFKLKEDIKIMESNAGIGGEIINRSPEQKPIIVMLYSKVDGLHQIVGLRIVDPSEKFYAFIVPLGEYAIIAFEDVNANLKYDPGEYFGAYGQPDQVIVSSLTTREDLNIDVSRTSGFPKRFPVDASKVTTPVSVRNVATGTVITLDNEKFSQEIADMGLWQPVTFLQEAGIGVYFLEPYNPKKIPILFVHGASGSPRHFQYLAEHIDRTRFQPWFYHYPSGLPLDSVSRYLNLLIIALHDDYRFKRLYVTAHSMGGLVSRSFILRNTFEDGNDYVKLFVSISTPWNGHDAAKKGVENAPATIPSWHDMIPDSPFIQSIFSREMRPSIPFYLMFSHKGDCSFFSDNNDGAVTIRSQLDMRAQADALDKWGFNYGHVDILSSPGVLNIYNDILSKTDKRR